ncbi:MAG: DUF998 domain-containing protein [Brevefilum sp.]|nr:DUF998 domain-containing protein [Brevefilum sp.]
MKAAFHKLLMPVNPNISRARWVILLLLALSVTALLLAPRLVPEGYSWLTHTTSESAAQGLKGAWLARLGFLLFGFAVVWLAGAASRTWARTVTWMHLAFGVLMISTAAFSHQPFIPGVAFDPVEDWLHSLTATLMGFAFAFGVLARFLQRGARLNGVGLFDLVAVGASVFIPLLMASNASLVGLTQRLMFLVAYIWYGKEAYTLPRILSRVKIAAENQSLQRDYDY